MRLERFWKRFLRRKGITPWILLVPVFWLISCVYYLLFVIRRKSITPRERLPVSVISVGNVSVGGTGKTPIVALLAQTLLSKGIRVGVVSSGWGRESNSSFIEFGARIQNMPISETGDEVRLLAEVVPTILFSIGPVKWKAAETLAQTNQVDVILVDDGFQHWRLHRDFDVVTFDASISEKQWSLFPLGCLREPFSALNRADAIILTRTSLSADMGKVQSTIKSFAHAADIYRAEFVSTELIGTTDRHQIAFLKDKRVTLFAGIGNFEAFQEQVSKLSARIDAAIELSDHQKYDEHILRHIAETAAKHNSDLFVTTGKDWVKLGNFDFGRPIYYLAQSVVLAPGNEKLIDKITAKLDLKTAKK